MERHPHMEQPKLLATEEARTESNMVGAQITSSKLRAPVLQQTPYREVWELEREVWELEREVRE
uniref:Uncharacterized protein n=1 Tax=Salix viminalis TaxID=40686 RepID=A0A6N2NHS8_SALVM